MLEKFCSKSDYTTKREKKWKSLFLQLVFENVDNSSDNLSVKFLPKIRKCLDPIPKKLEKFSKKIFLIEVFVSVLRKQFSHFCKKIIRKFRKCFDQNPEREEEVFKEVVGCTSYCSSERLESSSAKFAEYFLPKVGKKFAQISKKNQFSKMFFLPSKWSCEHVGTSFDSFVENSEPHVRKVLLKVWLHNEKRKKMKKSVSPTCFWKRR